MNTILELTIHEFGFPSIEDFARFSALNLLKNKLSVYEKQLVFFEKKYNLQFEQFQLDFHKIPHSLIEKEDDFMEWEGILHSYNSIQKKIKAIQENQPLTAIIDYKKRIEEYLSSV